VDTCKEKARIKASRLPSSKSAAQQAQRKEAARKSNAAEIGKQAKAGVHCTLSSLGQLYYIQPRHDYLSYYFLFFFTFVGSSGLHRRRRLKQHLC